MKRWVVWLCLLVWIASCAGTALAENEYARLCAQSGVVLEDTTAWIEIPGSGFCQPVMCRQQDDSFYAAHGADGAESEYGALYTQAAYNKADFSDPVTIVYGSSRNEGAPLRDLQETFSGRFDDCRSVLLHLPEETAEYEVFAAIPYSSVHILHYFDFTVKNRFDNFFDSVFSTRLLGMHLVQDARPEAGDKVLILSTGLRGDSTQRYLVMAKRITN